MPKKQRDLTEEELDAEFQKEKEKQRVLAESKFKGFELARKLGEEVEKKHGCRPSGWV